ncbi:YciI family protein [Martelella mediterranea]|uniref:YCII-related domain protein n=1 Tax=Martelella mediterranea DSM 17316 TaxID=1122214 RepID=A0A1U9YYR9_9HYPH|nr:YciI family protein [Martelella mediterranea]AQZ50595.1 YCII-related domain protein [Martelella mediterranea DSM 17316]
MILISLTYIQPLEEVEKYFDGHIAWLNSYYESGAFVASGRKVPRTGGVIMARGTMAAVEEICRQDPFVSEGVASFELTEVNFTRTLPSLEGLKDGD